MKKTKTTPVGAVTKMGGAVPATPETTAAMTAFAAESAALSAPGNTLASLFTTPDPEADAAAAELLGKLERRNLPPMLKPSDIPIGAAIQGEIIKFVPSPSPEIKGRLIWLRYRGQDFTFPCTGSVRNAFAPGLKDDSKELDGILLKEVGNYFYAKRGLDKPSKYKKNMFMFDVRTGKLEAAPLTKPAKAG